jgi:EAL domain-containing protein (putative c-di-GMP-specific phosphodiesterase class I)
LYHAKETGRNMFQYYSSTFNELILKRLEMTTALRMAMEKKQLFICYQPLFELHSDKIIGVEALLRWEHPTLGKISPKVFIPLAEETGLIQSIGEWVLHTACAQVKKWQIAGHVHLKVAVNISVKQFYQKNFIELIQQTLTNTQLDPKDLELEMTESIILNNFAEARQKMEILKNIGVCLVIDDFGTGYSSLSYLKYFSFDKIKIDKSFIDGLGKNTNDSTIVQAIMAIAKQLGITVLAEGVERKEQIKFIAHQQDNQVQGYYFSRPLDEAACTHLLEEKKLQPIQND